MNNTLTFIFGVSYALLLLGIFLLPFATVLGYILITIGLGVCLSVIGYLLHKEKRNV